MSEIQASGKVFLAAFAALLGALSVGLHLGYSGPALANMKNRSEILPSGEDTTNLESWIGSSLAIGALIGGLIVQSANTYLGRRKSLIASGIPMCISWLLIAFANNVVMVIIGRVIAGLCCGLLCGIAPTYVVEISPPKIRGTLGTCFQVMVTIGILIETVVILIAPWNVMAGINVIFGVLMSVLMIFMPETPQWYLSNGMNEEAEFSLKQLRQGPISEEFNTFVQAQEAQREQQAQNQSTGTSSYGRHFYIPLLYSLGLMFFQQFSGINAILFYQTSIYEKAVKSMQATHMTIIVCAAQVVATVIGSFLVDRLGRRLLLIASGAGHTISLIMFGFYNYQKDNGHGDDIAWLALLSLIIFISSFSIGFGPIPWMMVPELSGPQVRSLIASIATSFNWVCVFIVAFTVQPMLNTIGTYTTYWLYSAICVVSCLFVAVCLPETKGKTNEQIQREILGTPELLDSNAGQSRSMKSMA